MNSDEYAKVEIAKIIKAIQDVGVTDKEPLEVVKKILIPRDRVDAVEDTIRGLSEEDEFSLICRLMETTTHLVSLEQRPIIPGDYIVPDFLAGFQPGCAADGFTRDDSVGFKCFIEVKSTKKQQYKIGGSRLGRLRNFADAFQLPLLFAIRFLMFPQSAAWAIVEDSNRAATSLTITVKDLISGVRHILWDEPWYMLTPGVRIVFVFDLEYDGVGMINREYGVMTQLHITDGDNIVSYEGGEASVYAAFFEAFHLVEAGSKRKDSVTYVVFIPQSLVCSLADTIYKFNRLPCDTEGIPVFDASRILARQDQETYDRHLIDSIASSLASNGFLGYTAVDEPEVRRAKWRRYGGRG